MAVRADRESKATRKGSDWGEERDRIDSRHGKWAEVWLLGLRQNCVGVRKIYAYYCLDIENAKPVRLPQFLIHW